MTGKRDKRQEVRSPRQGTEEGAGKYRTAMPGKE